jgi:hypothetical protein
LGAGALRRTRQLAAERRTWWERGREVGAMLTVAYCRESTEEQAVEGFSIGGQADKLRF